MEKQPTDGILEEFRIEFLKCWNRLPNKGFFFVLLAAWLVLFQFVGNSTLGYVRTPSLMAWMYNAYNPPVEVADVDDSFGTVVPFVVLGLFWWKREKLLALPIKTWWPSVALVALGLIIHASGYVIQQPKVSIIGLFIGIYGLMGVAWGPAFLRESFFPFCLFAFALPLGSQAAPLTFRLRVLVCQLSEWVCHYALAIDVIRIGTALKDPTDHYQYEVAAACSGIRSLTSISMMAIVYGLVAFRPWWKRIVMIASAVPLAILGNLLRMLTIVIAAEWKGQQFGNQVHESTILGLIPYIPAILGLFMLGHFLEGKHEKTKGSDGVKPDSSRLNQNPDSVALPKEAQI
jgi:exosortase